MIFKKEIYFLIFSFCALAFLFFRLPYRSYIYSHHLFDFYIADTAPNFWAVPAFVFFKKWRKSKHSNALLCTSAFLGMVVYEYFLQSFFYDATIDHLDALASFFGTVVSYFVSEKADQTHAKA